MEDLANAAAALAVRSPSPPAVPMEQGTGQPTKPPTILVEGIQPITKQAAAASSGGERGNVSDKGDESDFDGVEVTNEEMEELGGEGEKPANQGNRGNPGNRLNQDPDRAVNEGRGGAR